MRHPGNRERRRSGRGDARELDRFRVPMNFPWLPNVYLGVNAVRDACALLDGPDGALYKALFLHGRHDTASTLLDVGGHHRIAFANVCSRGVVRHHDEIVARQLRALDALPESGLLLATALPMCSVTGTDYGRILRELRSELRKPALEIRPSSLLGDWLDGYAATLDALARGLDLDGAGKGRRTAAVVGYLWDRNEGDHRGNLAELRRIFAALDLELVSIWCGEAFLGAELRRVVPRLRPLLGPVFRHRRVAFVGDLHRLAGFRDLADDCGMTLVGAIVSGREGHGGGRGERNVLFEPPEDGVEVARVLGAADFVVGSRATRGLLAEAGPHPRYPGWVEFGFPSYEHHALVDRPFLGADGVLALVERMAEYLYRLGESRR